MANKKTAGIAAAGQNNASKLMCPVNTDEVQKIVSEAAARKNSISVYASAAQTDIRLSFT